MQYQTLVFVKSGDEILLGMKKRDFGKGKWNGYGGKLEDQETITTCARRELLEECNLEANEADLCHLGFIQIVEEGDIIRRVHVYICNKVTGKLAETDEMVPRWFKTNEIPYDQMWEDSYYWMPFIVKETKFEATFTMAKTKLIEINILIKE